ncbi:MAG: GDYXXLXY domain-containing protein [Nostocaceae cyanobacterium]|nr:GDYXXLXY domain-containing protein [Nostocaceae cyanobacterium]
MNEPLPEQQTLHNDLALTQETSTKPMSVWRLVLPLAIQAALIMAIPAQAVYTHITGRTVILQTVPVDPYDLLRGYSQILRYDISSTDTLKKLPGWSDLAKQYPGGNEYSPLKEGTDLYVILEAQKAAGGNIPKAWKPVQVSINHPSNLTANQVALKGKYGYGSVSYGLETYYMPEDQRDKINNEIAQARPHKPGQLQPIVMEVKVDPSGKSVPVSMWVQERNYRF